MANKSEVIQCPILGCTGSSEVFRGFQLVRIEEWSHLVGQLSQDALSESQAASLQWQSHNNDCKTHKHSDMHELCQSRGRVWASAYLEISERHELDDVSGGNVTSGWSQQFVIAVQKLHCAEVSRAHPHDDDGHGQARGLHNSGACKIHVSDHAVGDDEQHVVLLQARAKKIHFPNVRYSGAFIYLVSENDNSSTTYWGHVLPKSLSGKVGYVVDDWSKVGGAPELQLRETLLVGLNYALNPWHKATQVQYGWMGVNFISATWHGFSYLHKRDWRD